MQWEVRFSCPAADCRAASYAGVSVRSHSSHSSPKKSVDTKKYVREGAMGNCSEDGSRCLYNMTSAARLSSLLLLHIMGWMECAACQFQIPRYRAHPDVPALLNGNERMVA